MRSASGKPRDPGCRVCFVTRPPGTYSGATFHAMWLAEKLAALDVTVEFLSFHNGDAPHSARTTEGFRVHYLRKRFARYPELVLWPEFALFFQLRRGFDVLHVHSCGYLESFLGVAARLAGMASIANVMLHGSDLGPTGRLEAPLRNRLARAFHRIVPISEETRQEALQAGFEPSRIVKIPIGVDVDRFRPVATPGARAGLRARFALPPDRPIVTFVGALNARKNIVWLLDAWERRPPELESALLLVVGDAVHDPEGPEIRHQVAERIGRLGRAARWIPFVREIEQIYTVSDALVLPSLAEGMPSVVLQAMASGVPVVTTPVSGVRELVGERMERGWLFDFNRSDQLWDALRALLAGADRHRSVARAAREHVVAHCSLDVVAGRYRELYASIARPRSARP